MDADLAIVESPPIDEVDDVKGYEGGRARGEELAVEMRQVVLTLYPPKTATMMRSHSSSWNTSGRLQRARRHEVSVARQGLVRMCRAGGGGGQ